MDIQVSTTNRTDLVGQPRIDYQGTNRYTSPLVSILSVSICPDSHNSETSLDVALEHSWAIEPGRHFGLLSLPPSCAFKTKAAIFADGRMDGEPEVIQRLLDRRKYAKAIVERILNHVNIEFRQSQRIDAKSLMIFLQDALNHIDERTNENSDRVVAEEMAIQGAIRMDKKLLDWADNPGYADKQQEFFRFLYDWHNILDLKTYTNSDFVLLAPPPRRPANP